MKTGLYVTAMIAACFIGMAIMIDNQKHTHQAAQERIQQARDSVQLQHHLRLSMMEVCEEILIRDPGGLTHSIALICYNQESGWIEINTARLPTGDYQRMVQPVKDSLRTVAFDRGIYNELHDGLWRVR